MSASKTNVYTGLLAKLDTSFGANASLSGTTDAIEVMDGDGLSVTPDYAVQGDRGKANGSGGLRKAAAPIGATLALTAKVAIKGKGADYALSTDIVPDVHNLLIACGYSATRSGGAGAGKWTFTPQTSGYSSLVAQATVMGESYKLSRGYGDVTISADGSGPAVAEFSFDGTWDTASNAEGDPSGWTYSYYTVDAPFGQAASVSIGSWTSPVVSSFKFTSGRARTPRRRITAANGHQGWTMGARVPELEITCEAPAWVTTPFHASGGLDAWRLQGAATGIAVTLTWGSVQFNRMKINLAQAQLVKVANADDGATAMKVLTFRPYVTTPQASDDLTLVWD